MISKIISGGQTGVDRAALDVAMELRLPCGGWCPKGRKSEDGMIPEHYPLLETTLTDYPQRTDWNVRDGDGTLILFRGEIKGGTALTQGMARKRGKPVLSLDLNNPSDAESVLSWIAQHGIRILNIAGPRESENPGIHEQAVNWLRPVLAKTISSV